MYNGFTASQEQDRARWELMQRRAKQAMRNTRQIIAARRIATSQHTIDHLLWALAMKRQQEGIR
jgi:hypothetical protein